MERAKTLHMIPKLNYILLFINTVLKLVGAFSSSSLALLVPFSPSSPPPPSPRPRRFSRVLLTESTNSFKLCALPEVTISSVIKNYICTQKLIPKIAKSQCRRVTLVSNRSGTVKQNLQSHTPQSSQDLLIT